MSTYKTKFLKRLLSLRMLLLLIPLGCFSQGNAQNNISWAVQQLQSLAPAEYEVLRRYEELPGNFTVKTPRGTMTSEKSIDPLAYMQGGDRMTCLVDLSTNVHEINHLITSLYGYVYSGEHNRVMKERSMYYFYIGAGTEMPVFSNVDFFPSRLLISEIPKGLRTFRFNTYIAGTSSTQNDGLLGLLDEYNAYQHSLNTVWEMKDAYAQAKDDELSGYIGWMSTLCSYVESYYEFNFYILEYLRYAKLNKPDVYLQIKNEPDLITVFNAITASFKNVISRYDLEISVGCRNYWQSKGYQVKLSPDQKYLFIGKDGSSIGFNILLEDKEKLLPTIESGRYNEVERELKIF